MKNEKVNGSEANAENGQSEEVVWTREKVEKHLGQDLTAARSLLGIIEEDPKVFQIIVDVIYDRINEPKPVEN